MGGQLNKRMMDAESSANKYIEVKDYHHTSAYAQLSGDTSSALLSNINNGKALNQILMQRAREHLREQARMNDYNASHLGGYNFRRAKLNDADEQDRKKILLKQSHDRDKKQRDFLKERRVNARKGREADLGGSIDSGKSKASNISYVKSDFRPHLPDDNIKESTPGRHHFQEPASRRYDPYA